MLRVLPCLVLLLLLGTGCSPGAAPTPASSALPPAAASPTAGAPFFTPFSTDPVLSHGADGSWYSHAVEPGAVVQAGGRMYLFFNAMSGWPAQAAVGLAVSDDGLSWTPLDAPLLDSAAETFEGYSFFASSVVTLPDGRWAMYLYTLAEGRDGAPGEILIATAPEIEGPWSLQAGPALSPGESGSWNGSRVTQPSVLRVEDGYRMYFSGYENDRLQGGRWIGVAESQDGLHWEMRPDPVLSPSADPRAWDAFRVFQPRVMQTDGGFLMLYKSNVSVGRNEGWGLAASRDGIEWDRLEVNPIITEKTYTIEWRRNGIADLLTVDGELFLFLEILEREGGAYHHGNADYRSNIFLFTAPMVP